MRVTLALVAAVLLSAAVVLAPPAAAAPLTGPPAAGAPNGIFTPQDCSRGCTITTPNTTWDHLAVTGTINVRATGFTLTNSMVTAESYYGVNVIEGSASLNRVTITRSSEAALTGDNWTATRLEVTDTIGGDGIKLGSGCTLRLSYIHDIGHQPGDHSDGIQVQAGIVNAAVLSSWIDVGPDSDAMFVAPDLGPGSDGPLTITGNVFGGGGGGYTVAIHDGGRPCSTCPVKVIRNVSIVRNQFLDGTSTAGPLVVVDTPATVRGNVMFTSRAAVTA